MKYSLLLLTALFFISGCANTSNIAQEPPPPEPPAPAPAPRPPAPVRPNYSQRVLVNREIVSWIQQVQYTDDIHKLVFYLDKSFSLEFDNLDKSPIVGIGYDGMLIISARAQADHLRFDIMQQGEILGFSPESSETFVINLKVQDQLIKLNFKKNAKQDFFELFSMGFTTGTYLIKLNEEIPTEEFPKLYIYATIDENIRNDYVHTADYIAVPISEAKAPIQPEAGNNRNSETINNITDRHENVYHANEGNHASEHSDNVTGLAEGAKGENHASEHSDNVTGLAEGANAAKHTSEHSDNATDVADAANGTGKPAEHNGTNHDAAPANGTSAPNSGTGIASQNRNQTAANQNTSPSNNGAVIAVAQSNVRQNGSSNNLIADGILTEDAVFNYIKSRGRNFALTDDLIRRLISLYIEEAKNEEVNYDFAIAQMLHRTNLLGNSQVVRSNNFGGLSRTDLWDGNFPNHPNFRNDGMREGVKAHIQHLRGYASATVKREPIVNPRYHLVAANIRGTVKTFDQLYGRWTSNPDEYKKNIETLLDNMYSFSENQISRR